MPQRVVEVEYEHDFYFQDELIRKTVPTDRKVCYLTENDADAWTIMEKIRKSDAVTSIKKRCLNINDMIGDLR